jgi:hypothetical protein
VIRAYAVALALGLMVPVAIVSCSAVPSDARIGIDAPNGSEEEFGIVGDYLDHRCGSLDCHGQPGRNLRIWGCEGMRLDPHDVPLCSVPQGGSQTTSAEHQATYRSLVGLEPAVMSTVVEAHKGGVLIAPGDDQDVCVTSWLAGATDVIACANAIGYPAFPMDSGAE